LRWLAASAVAVMVVAALLSGSLLATVVGRGRSAVRS
jgi:hypothetical protein